MQMVKKLKYFILLALFSATAAASGPKGTVGGIKTIVIDPGHGGKDPGCHGVNSKEKDISLAVALKLGKCLESYYKDVKVIYTRTTDVFVELEDRAQIANKAKADLFISIHCNAAGKAVIVKDPHTGKKRKKMYRNKKGKMVPVETINPIPFGTETYVMGLKNEAGKMRVATRENSAILLEDDYEKKYGGFDPESEESYIIMSNYTSAYVIQSANLAVKIQEEYTRKAGRIDKGVHRQSIWVLWRTSMPSILTEIGYLTNPLEETFMASEQGQDYLAKSIFRGVRRYKDEVEGTKKDYNDEYENQAALENENIKAGNSPNIKKNDDDLDDDDGPDEPAADQKNDPNLGSEQPIKKTPVDDGRGPVVTLSSGDSTERNGTKKDTTLSAKEIALKFRNEKKPPAKNEPAEGTKTLTVATQDIIFKVQIASSEVPIDLKQEKYAAVVDGGFYRHNTAYKYTSGNFSKFKDAVAHQDLLRKNGFKDCFVIAIKSNERIDLNVARKTLGQ
jgi:N-acetylmuramoyl-L-alanine amidase